MSQYLQYLIWMMLFAIVIEMVFPDSTYRKYIKLILGCILIYTMLRPIAGMIQIDGANYKAYVEKYQAALSSASYSDSTYEEALGVQVDYLETIYKAHIKELIEQQFDIEVISVELEMNSGEIDQIALVVCQPSQVFQIGTIHIGDKSDSVDGDEAILKNKLKTCLYNFYNVQVGNIHITVQKN